MRAEPSRDDLRTDDAQQLPADDRVQAHCRPKMAS